MDTATVVLIVLLVGVAAFVLLRTFGSTRAVDPQVVQAARERGATLIDVRSADEFASGHVAGALNVPVDALIADPSAAGSKDKAVIVYCRSGARSARAAGALKAAGYQVIDLGGIATARSMFGS